jgi:hypothetical protein
MNKSMRLLSIILMLASCSSKQEKILCRTWQVSDVRFNQIEKTLVQSDTIKGDEQRIRMMLIKEALMLNVYTFNADGTYKTGNAAATSGGKWEVSGNNIVFISAEKNTQEKKFQIEHLSVDSLILNMRNDQTTESVELLLTPIAP